MDQILRLGVTQLGHNPSTMPIFEPDSSRMEIFIKKSFETIKKVQDLYRRFQNN